MFSVESGVGNPRAQISPKILHCVPLHTRLTEFSTERLYSREDVPWTKHSYDFANAAVAPQ